MKKPDDILITLATHSPFVGIEVRLEATGTDTSETQVRLTPDAGKRLDWMPWYSVRPYIELRVDHATIATLSPKARDEYKAWKKFESDNKRELTTYNRLKKKFEGGQ